MRPIDYCESSNFTDMLRNTHPSLECTEKTYVNFFFSVEETCNPAPATSVTCLRTRRHPQNVRIHNIWEYCQFATIPEFKSHPKNHKTIDLRKMPDNAGAQYGSYWDPNSQRWVYYPYAGGSVGTAQGGNTYVNPVRGRPIMICLELC